MKHLIALVALLAGAALAAPPAGTKLADEANAAGTHFKLAAPALVSYGAGTSWTEKTLEAGTYACHPTAFGLPTTLASPRKQCRLTLKGGGVAPVAPPAVAEVALTADAVVPEDSRFALVTAGRVSFGRGSSVVLKSLAAGTYTCGRAEFGADPAPGAVKECRAAAKEAPAAEKPVDLPTVPAPVVDDDISTPEKYRALAATMGTDAGVTYRYGNPSSLPLPSTTYPGPRANMSYQTVSIQRFEKQKDGNVGDRGCGRDSWCGGYQIGDYLTGAALDYSSNICNVAYVPTLPKPAGFQEAKYFGISALQCLGVNHNTISLKPEVSWTTYTGPASNNGDTDENTRRLAGTVSGSPIGTFALDAKPVAITRGYGRGGWVTNALAVFADGRITSSGSNTSHNFVHTKLPDGFTPTGIAITNSGEFALVPGMDTNVIKGRVAVLAITEGCQWCEVEPDSNWRGEWGNHRGRFPGIPGLGNYLDIKLVGFVDLPDNLKAPTEIAVTTGNDGGRDTGYQVIMNFWDQPLTDERTRKRIRDDDWQRAVSRTGMAVVTSKLEQTATFIDLRPLFSYYRSQYFDVDNNGWKALLAKRGPGATQWPYTFDVAPAQKPTIIKTVTLPARPTASEMTRQTPHRAFIATEEGKLRVFDLGSGYLAQDANATGKPADIVERFSVDVGANPTSISFMKEKGRHGPGQVSRLWGDNTNENRFWWVLSREERKASMLKFDAGMNSASVFKTLQTRQIVDPIAIEDADNHGTESYVMTFADYSGSRIHNVWYGPIVMWTHLNNKQPAPCRPDASCLPQGGAEYAGSHLLPGKPTHVVSSNIN
jgi:hypothetical protein